MISPKLLTSDGVSGTAVAISGDTVAVGASAADIGANVDQGAVYLFKRNHGGADTWGEVARITAEDVQPMTDLAPPSRSTATFSS